MPLDPLPPEEIAVINDRAFRAGLTIPEVLARAKVPVSYWSRWRRLGVMPRKATLERLTAALESMIAERTAPDGC